MQRCSGNVTIYLATKQSEYDMKQIFPIRPPKHLTHQTASQLSIYRLPNTEYRDDSYTGNYLYRLKFTIFSIIVKIKFYINN